MVEVVAALIWRGPRFLICQRPKHKARALYWEFVGGKVEPNETKEAALIRECMEELDVAITVQKQYYQVRHTYPDIDIELTLFHASILEGEPKLLEHEDLRWILPSEISNYAFCPADEAILKQIQADYEN
jgi:8-oxo-dGTP diphosphatase